MKTVVHVDPVVTKKEPERHFKVAAEPSGRLSLYLADAEGSILDGACLLYISPQGCLGVCSYVDTAAAEMAGIQLEERSRKIKVIS